jgi:hypothetical protein
MDVAPGVVQVHEHAAHAGAGQEEAGQDIEVGLGHVGQARPRFLDNARRNDDFR